MQKRLSKAVGGWLQRCSGLQSSAWIRRLSLCCANLAFMLPLSQSERPILKLLRRAPRYEQVRGGRAMPRKLFIRPDLVRSRGFFWLYYPAIVDYMASAAPTTSPYYQWQYVAFDKTSIWSAPRAIQHLFNQYQIDPDNTKAKQPFAVDPDAENFVLNVTLSISPTPNPLRPFAELTFLTPCIDESDHPNPDGVDNGPQWLAWVLNAIGGSLDFPNTAVVVTLDDWGGYFDNYSPSPWPFHPNPNAYNNADDPNEWGFRVPLILISPYVKKAGYISATKISQGAILNFIEDIFGLPSNALQGDDLNNGTNDLTDMLDFTNTPVPWTDLPTKFSPAPVGSCPSPKQL